ncbi:phage tail tape measure protein [Bacillus thuringiensis]|uniref:phage tail tape measure protein n=1 Tax=Bacillus thuringiensis TaxID=1428 RepID=UPI00211DEAD0|nr:phage tail tape measure protein [Bacillus thuringiensis]
MAADGSIVIDTLINSRSVEPGLNEVQSKLQKVGAGLQTAGESMSKYVTLPLAAVGGVAMKMASDVDSSQHKLQASLGLTAKGAENLNGIVKNVWKEGFGENLDEVNLALTKVYQNMRDVPHEELQGATENVLTLAKMYDVDLNEATRGAGQLMSQFGLSTQETFDLLAAGAQNGLNYSDELFDNLSEYAPLFKQAGFTADEMFTILSNGTKDGSYNLDYINDLVKEFGIRVQDGSKGVSDGFGELSKETQGVWAAFNDGKATTADVFNAVLGDLSKMDDKVKANQIGVALFGTKWEDMGADVVLGLNNINGGLGDTTGAMDKMKKQAQEAFSVKLQKAIREAGLALEPLGKILIDMALIILPKVSSAIKTVTDWFNNLSPSMQKTVAIVGVVLMALGPLLLILGQFAFALSNLMPAFSLVVKGMKMLNLAFLSNPFTLIVAAVVLAGALIYRYWDEISAFLISSWEYITTTAQEIWNGLTDFFSVLWNDIKEYFVTTWEEIKTKAVEIWQSITDFFANTWESVKTRSIEIWQSITEFFIGIWEGIKQLAVQTWDSIKNTTIEIWQSISDFFMGIWNGIVAFLTPILEGIANFFSMIWNGISTVIQTVWTFISQYLQAIWTAILYFATPIFESIKNFIISVWDAISSTCITAWNYISSFLLSIWESIKEIAITVWDYISKFLSRTWEWIKTTAINIWNTIVRYFNTVWDVISSTAITVWDFISNFLVSVWQSISSTASYVWNGIINLIIKYWNKLKDFVIPIFNGIGDTISQIWNWIASTSGDIWNGVVNTLANIWGSINQVASSVWNGIIDTIMTPVNWICDKVVYAFEAMKIGAVQAWNGIISGIKATINSAIYLINKFIQAFNLPARALNMVPGVSAPIIPYIPYLAKGGNIMGNGNAIVGEAGPELISKSGGSVKVTPLSGGEKAGGIGGALGGGGSVNLTLNYQGNNPNDAYKMLDIIDQGLRNKVDINNIMRGNKG